jgi:hypothetical protein
MPLLFSRPPARARGVPFSTIDRFIVQERRSRRDLSCRGASRPPVLDHGPEIESPGGGGNTQYRDSVDQFRLDRLGSWPKGPPSPGSHACIRVAESGRGRGSFSPPPAWPIPHAIGLSTRSPLHILFRRTDVGDHGLRARAEIGRATWFSRCRDSRRSKRSRDQVVSGGLLSATRCRARACRPIGEEPHDATGRGREAARSPFALLPHPPRAGDDSAAVLPVSCSSTRTGEPVECDGTSPRSSIGPGHRGSASRTDTWGRCRSQAKARTATCRSTPAGSGRRAKRVGRSGVLGISAAPSR